MPIFTDEPTDLIPNTAPATVVKSVQIPVGGNLNAPKVPEPNKDADRTFRTQEELKTSLLFSSDRDLKNITAEVKGMKWEVDYFMQIRDINDQTTPPDIQLNKNVQKYNKINNLILFVQNAITQDAPSNLSGEAYINAGIVPNVNDVFRATLTGGREAMFLVSEVQNNTYNLHRCFLIAYKFLFFIDAHVKLYNNIKSKIVTNYYYNKDYIKDYSAPLLLKEDYQNIIDLTSIRSDIIDYYLKKFTNRKETSGVMHLPTVMGELAVDTYLEQFVFKTMSTEDNIKLRDLTRIYIPEEDGIDYTIYDLILDRKVNNWPMVARDIGWNYINYANNTYTTSRNLIYMGVQYTIQKNGKVTLRVVPNITDDRPNDYEEPIVRTEKNTYVFGEYFYRREAEHCGILEKAVLRFIKGDTVDGEVLAKMLREYHYWNIEEQYYGLPILLVLLKDYINNSYRSI